MESQAWAVSPATLSLLTAYWLQLSDVATLQGRLGTCGSALDTKDFPVRSQWGWGLVKA